MTFDEKVYAVVKNIPKGRVTTYGLVARAVGSPRASRIVGGSLHRNPYFGEVPCHRVVNKSGRLAPCFAFGGDSVQQEMLENEGISFVYKEELNGTEAVPRVDMEKHLFIPEILCEKE